MYTDGICKSNQWNVVSNSSDQGSYRQQKETLNAVYKYCFGTQPSKMKHKRA